ncbi:MAG TPA: cytochrome c3 family protein [Candidatus Eisenbacteria bacterium]|nr:cytochrome c3 family protein [Candidatus Eisenbacteria bacterium]
MSVRRLSFSSLPFFASPRLLWCLVSVLALGCSRNEPEPKSESKLGASVTKSNAVEVSDHEATLPHVGGLAGYVGSKDCRACHEDQFASWHRSYHRTMTQIAGADSVQADFHNVTLTNDGTRFVLTQKGNEFWVHLERAAPAPPDETAPEPVDVRVGLVTGSHHMQVFWIGNGMGNCQIGFPFTWLIPERRWVPRNSTFLRPPGVELRPETWNFVCARCHATATQPNYDRTTKTWNTQVDELGIACEACHGPGERHAAQQRGSSRQRKEADFREPKPSRLLTSAATNYFIVHPEKISPVRSAQVCGFCHSMKWFDSSEGWPERGFSFRPGDDLEATTPIIRPKEIDRQPWLKKVLEKSPELFADFFWSDGMVRVSGRDYNGLIESPCYRGGQFSCLSCHSLHSSEPDGQLARNRADNRACTQCHENFREEPRVVAHTHHRAGSTGSECYNCHMPRTTYGVLKAIRSHQISGPRITEELATGRPNACNLCHLDKPLAWTADQLARWYRQPIPKLTEDQTKVADAVRLALTGDAGQRAIIAWHLGWEPAWQVSGQSWIPPVLAQLLDDPYAAVRCVAERSLKHISANLLPAGYDYTTAPDSRPSVQAVILDRWRQEIAKAGAQNFPAPSLVRLNDPTSQQEEFQRLLRQRDDRPVRLRE